MEEIDLYNRLSILHDELGHLKILSDNNNFYQCFAEDENINNELSKALEKIELGKQFAFYNLGISKEDQELLSNIEIIGNENKVIRSEECKYFNHCILNVVEKTIAEKSIKVNAHQANILINYITKITNNIFGKSDGSEFELIIRTMNKYSDNHETNSCEYWHIDKSYEDIIKDNTSKIRKYIGNKVFLIPIIDNEISSKKEEIKKLGYFIENKKPTLNQKQTELDQAISIHASYKSDLSVAESENCWRHSPGRYDQNCLNKKENLRDKVNHWSRYKSKYQNEKNDIESDIKAFEDKKQKIANEIAALEEKSRTLSENEDVNYLNKMLDGVMYYQHQEDLEDINVINDSSYVHSINQVEATYQN
ncbi:uncharacterized protein TRIADDRAFT_62625 [Trichoplax adhaerens]|uniref:Uncharacterized protein n=1 Tax=Trichoplax adhaerens TaxID=10228 RepID=B3SED0_TRIAD|nr:predicted protein [Trichoplax adhaerens]EDV18913.1 predicted protein [Trichoplax adhaerens]|eukprot:XP_002118599.1 predicted protein [Trichoplax adhaerens]